MTAALVVERAAPAPEPCVAHERADVAVVRLDRRADALHDAASLLAPDERERARLFLDDLARDRFVAGRAVLREHLGRRLGIEPGAVRFAYNEHGKPLLHPRHGAGRLAFNVSHAGDLLALAFHDAPVGIDIEAEHAVAYADEIVARFFSPRERREYDAIPPQQRPRAFLAWWTRKEAFVKALGIGLDRPLAEFDVSLAPGAPAAVLRVGDVPGASAGWRLEAFAPAPGFVGAVVARVPGSSEGFR
jgi:4'-phosphopantetheinyl transferase